MTNIKRKILNQEYDRLQRFLHGDKNVSLYSANKQQALRYYKKIKPHKEYPISLRKDLIDIQKCNSDVCDYFVKIPVAGRYGGVNIPVNCHIEIKGEWEICESKMYRRDGRFFLNITVKIAVEEMQEYHGVLGIDLGLRNPVVSVALPSKKVEFRGQNVKRIQTHYFYLRRNSKTGKEWKRREHNKVRDKIHKLTTKIADFAEQQKLIVTVGDLKGIQKQDKGRKMNRKLHRFPHYSFRKILEYKCQERGIKYIEVSEAYTSQRCCKCDKMGRRHRGIFKCGGSELNSDVNGAWNIGKRALGKPEIRSMLSVGAPVTVPELQNGEATSGALCG
ncbi:MAG: RNA-guided endonuclease InsQ/TnpB family protein [Thermoproteota archaeon]